MEVLVRVEVTGYSLLINHMTNSVQYIYPHREE